MNSRRSGACWMSWKEASSEYDRRRNLAAACNSSWLGLDPFHLAGNVRGLIAGRRTSDVAWSVSQRTLCRHLRCALADVDGAAGYNDEHQAFCIGRSGKRTVAFFCGATRVAPTDGRDRTGNRAVSNRQSNSLAETLVILQV